MLLDSRKNLINRFMQALQFRPDSQEYGQSERLGF